MCSGNVVEYMSDPARGLLSTLAFSGHVATPRLLGASGCQFDSGEDRTINMVPPVRSPRSTAVCEDLSPFVCELRKRSKIVPKVTRGNSRPGTSALPRNTAVSDIQQQPRAASWGRVEYMSDPARGLLSTLAFSGSRIATPRLLGCEWLPVRLWGGSNH